MIGAFACRPLGREPTPAGRIQACVLCFTGATTTGQFTANSGVGTNTMVCPNITATSDGVVISAAHWQENTTSVSEFVGYTTTNITARSPTPSDVGGVNGIRMGVGSTAVTASQTVTDPTITRVNDTSPSGTQQHVGVSFLVPSGVFVSSVGHANSSSATYKDITLPMDTGDYIVMLVITRNNYPVVDGGSFDRRHESSFTFGSTKQYLSVYTKVAEVSDPGRTISIVVP